MHPLRTAQITLSPPTKIRNHGHQRITPCPDVTKRKDLKSMIKILEQALTSALDKKLAFLP